MLDWILLIIGWLVNVSLIVLILMMFLFIAWIVAYILLSFGLYQAAQKRNLQFPWMAWLPFARYYLVGTMLRNELTITPRTRIPYFQYILPVASALPMLVYGPLAWLVTLAVYALVVLAYIALFRQYGEASPIVCGVLAGLPFLEIIGSFLVFRLGRKDAPASASDKTVFP
jgi:hypothetical protein